MIKQFTRKRLELLWIGNKSLMMRTRTLNMSYQLMFSQKNNDDRLSPEVIDKLKQDAQQFYNSTIAPKLDPIVELKTMQEWQTEVVQSTVPVVLDCYATWCGPCKQLTPVLEKKAKEGNGKWKLVKLDIDKFAQIATSLQIKSVPTVILVHNGNAIDGFTGFPDQTKLQQFFSSVDKAVQPQNKLDTIKDIMAEMNHYFEEGKTKEIKDLVDKTFKDPAFNKVHAWLHACLGGAHLMEGSTGKCAEILKMLETKYQEELKSDKLVKSIYESLQKELQDFTDAKKDNQELNNMLTQLDNDPKNLDLRFQIAEYCFTNELFEEAIQQCIDMMKIDRVWQDRKAQQFVLKIFEKLGSSNSLVIEGRKKMQRLLY